MLKKPVLIVLSVILCISSCNSSDLDISENSSDSQIISEEKSMQESNSESDPIGDGNIFYVSPQGSDENPGSEEKPFATVNEAAFHVKPGDTVYVADGVYYGLIKPPFSGIEGNPINFRALPGHKPVLTNSILYEGTWERYKDNIYVADIDDYFYDIDMTNYRVFFNGESGIEACYPNMPGTTPDAMFQGYSWDIAAQGTNYETIYTSNLPEGDLAGANIAMMAGSGWNIYTRTISSVSGNTLTVNPTFTESQDGFTESFPYTPKAGNKFYIYGALDLLDAPGEYFFDIYGMKLYVYTPDGTSPSEYRIDIQSNAKNIINLDNLEYINFKGFDIYGNGISMDNTSFCKIENCRIRYYGYSRGDLPYPINKDSYPFYISGQGNILNDNEISNTGVSGIGLAGTGNEVSNSLFFNIGYGGMDYAAITILTGAKDFKIIFNTIKDCARFGIYVPAGAKLENGIISNNLIKDYGLLTADCGAFYTWNTNGGGTQIFNNFVDGSRTSNGQVDGLYLDNYCRNFSVYRNIVRNVSTGLRVNLTSTNNIVHNNTLINCKYGIGIYGYPKDNADMSGSKLFNNLIVNLSTDQAYAYYAFEDGKEVAKGGQFENGKIPVLSGSKAPLSGGNISGEVDENFLPKGNAIDEGILFEGFIGEYSGTNPCVGALESDGELFQYG